MNDFTLDIKNCLVEDPNDRTEYTKRLNEYNHARERYRNIKRKIDLADEISESTANALKNADKDCRHAKEALSAIYDKIRHYNHLSPKQIKQRKIDKKRREIEHVKDVANKERLTEMFQDVLKTRAAELKHLNINDPDKFFDLFIGMIDAFAYCREPIREHIVDFKKDFLTHLLSK